MFIDNSGLLGVCFKPIVNAFVVTLTSFCVNIVISVVLATRLNILKNVVHGLKRWAKAFDYHRRCTSCRLLSWA